MYNDLTMLLTCVQYSDYSLYLGVDTGVVEQMLYALQEPVSVNALASTII